MRWVVDLSKLAVVFRGERGRQHFFGAALGLALLAALPMPAHAAGLGPAGESWPMWLAAGIQVAIAITVGTVQSGQARIVRLNDERVAALASTLDVQSKALAGRIDEIAQRLQTTREDYARRADMEAKFQALSEELKEVRHEFKGDIRELRDDVKALDTDLKKVLALLSPRSP